MSGSILLRDVRVLGGEPTSLHIRAGRIAAIGEEAPPGPPPATVFDGGGRLVALPGLVDLHTHLREPGYEESETVASGTRAAAAGGYTDVFAMANTNPVTDTAARVEHMRRLADGAAARVHPVGAVTRDLAGAELADIDGMLSAGVTVYSDDGHCVDNAALLREAMQLVADRATIAQHAQCRDLAGAAQVNEGPVADRLRLKGWPAVAEASIIARDIAIAEDCGSRLHICHISTRQGVELVRRAKSAGLPVTAEATPHHLFLAEDVIGEGDPRFKVNPPLRTKDDVAAVLDGLIDGTIDAVATDHAPHPSRSKCGSWLEAAFGMTGLETALAVVVDRLTERGAMSWSLVARAMSTAPAAIGGLDPASRELIADGPATLCLVDPDASWTVGESAMASRSANTPFPGRTFTHRPVLTMLDGAITFDLLTRP